MNDKEPTPIQMQNSLYDLNDEIMSMLHSHNLKAEKIESEKVILWLRELYGFVQEGLGKESTFNSKG